MVLNGRDYKLALFIEISMRNRHFVFPKNTASRGGKTSKDSNASSVFIVTSRAALAAGEWHHIATVYDLRRLSLYIDGELQGSVDVYPTVGAHNSLSGTTFGSLNPWLNQCSDAFIGDLRNIRAYGRNLSPNEFLIAK